jgi:hypothetical protein
LSGGPAPNSYAPASGRESRAYPSRSVEGASSGSAAPIATDPAVRWKSCAAGSAQPNGAVDVRVDESGEIALLVSSKDRSQRELVRYAGSIQQIQTIYQRCD